MKYYSSLSLSSSIKNEMTILRSGVVQKQAESQVCPLGCGATISDSRMFCPGAQTPKIIEAENHAMGGNTVASISWDIGFGVLKLGQLLTSQSWGTLCGQR